MRKLWWPIAAGQEVGHIAHHGHGGLGDGAHALDLLRVFGRSSQGEHSSLWILLCELDLGCGLQESGEESVGRAGLGHAVHPETAGHVQCLEFSRKSLAQLEGNRLGPAGLLEIPGGQAGEGGLFTFHAAVIQDGRLAAQLEQERGSDVGGSAEVRHRWARRSFRQDEQALQSSVLQVGVELGLHRSSLERIRAGRERLARPTGFTTLEIIRQAVRAGCAAGRLLDSRRPCVDRTPAVGPRCGQRPEASDVAARLQPGWGEAGRGPEAR